MLRPKPTKNGNTTGKRERENKEFQAELRTRDISGRLLVLTAGVTSEDQRLLIECLSGQSQINEDWLVIDRVTGRCDALPGTQRLLGLSNQVKTWSRATKFLTTLLHLPALQKLPHTQRSSLIKICIFYIHIIKQENRLPNPAKQWNNEASSPLSPPHLNNIPYHTQLYLTSMYFTHLMTIHPWVFEFWWERWELSRNTEKHSRYCETYRSSLGNTGPKLRKLW